MLFLRKISGSQRKDLLDRAEESLSGRVAILDMNNLSINEILGKDNSPFEVNLAKDSQRSLRYTLKESQAFEYIVKGFFPVLYADPSINISVFYSSYITTYLGKDLRDIINIKDEFKFLNFLKLLASNTGEEFDNLKEYLPSKEDLLKRISVLDEDDFNTILSYKPFIPTNVLPDLKLFIQRKNQN